MFFCLFTYFVHRSISKSKKAKHTIKLNMFGSVNNNLASSLQYTTLVDNWNMEININENINVISQNKTILIVFFLLDFFISFFYFFPISIC